MFEVDQDARYVAVVGRVDERRPGRQRGAVTFEGGGDERLEQRMAGSDQLRPQTAPAGRVDADLVLVEGDAFVGAVERASG